MRLSGSLGLAALDHRSLRAHDTSSQTQSPSSGRSLSPAPVAGIFRPFYQLIKPHLSRLQIRSRHDSFASAADETASLSPDGIDHAYRKQVLQIRIEQAENYQDWLAAATELDALEGNNEWKLIDDPSEFDVALVKARLLELDETRLSSNQAKVLLLVRTALTRNIGGMGDRSLYKHCRVGTKKTIERYIESVLETIDSLVELSKSPSATIDQQVVLREMIMTRQAFGRSALLLSGGGTFGMNHIGVVKVLLEAKLLPRLISGASAGSIVCAVLCTKVDSEIPQILQEFCYGDLAVFEKEGEETSLVSKAFRFLTEGCLFDIKNLNGVMQALIGDLTFQEAYNRTQRILNICVSTASLYELPRLLNYVTAPNVMIWSAVAASCSVPFVFTPAQILAKDPATGEHRAWNPSPQTYIDGSVDNDLPMTRLAEMFNVNHFIVSQVNPHVVPFLERHEDGVGSGGYRANVGANYASWPSWVHKLTGLAKSEAMHRMELLQEIGFLPNAISKLQSVLGQRYSGDITILPKISFANFPRVLSNPSTEFMLEAMLSGERATWPKLAEIRNHCAIELAIDKAVSRIMTNVAFSPSQTNLRRLAVRSTDNSMLTLPRNGLSGHGVKTRSSRSHGTSVDLTRLQMRQNRSRTKSPHRRVWFGFDSMPGTTRPSPKVAQSSPWGGNSCMPGYETRDKATDQEEYDDEDEEEEYETDDDISVSSEDLSSASSLRAQLWPSTRQIIPFASQPATPLAMRKPMSFANLAGLNSRTVTTTPTPSGAGRPSSPEMTYKKLFHGGQSTGVTGPGLPKGRDGGKVSLELDISGTKGMMRRRKRSLSTGIRASKISK